MKAGSLTPLEIITYHGFKFPCTVTKVTNDGTLVSGSILYANYQYEIFVEVDNSHKNVSLDIVEREIGTPLHNFDVFGQEMDAKGNIVYTDDIIGVNIDTNNEQYTLMIVWLQLLSVFWKEATFNFKGFSIINDLVYHK